MLPDTTPVIVGVARYTHRILTKDLSDALTPLQLMAVAAKEALADAKVRGSELDCVATMLHMHTIYVPPGLPPHYPNPPKSLANKVGAAAAVSKNNLYMQPMGGNGPQEILSSIGEEIANGRMKSALIAGSEALAAFKLARKAGMALPGVTEITDMSGRTIKLAKDTKVLPWGDDPGGEPRSFVRNKALISQPQAAHGLAAAPNAYSLFDQAYRRERYQHIPRADYQKELGRMMAEFSEVAKRDGNHSWATETSSVEDITTVSRANRIVAYPYPRVMNSNIDVDQSAALVVMSIAEARRLGVPEEKFVFIHAHSEVAEENFDMLIRPKLTVSPALRAIRERLESTLQQPLSTIPHKEIYSCFPVAVRHASSELGIPFSHVSEISKTGGMQFGGGPGNNFNLHSIVAMMEVLRKDRGEKGLVTANGGFFSKHAAAVYSTEPTAWVPSTKAADQKKAKDINGTFKKVVLDRAPNGPGVLEVWTVEFSIHGPKRAIGLGSLQNGKRFLATSTDEVTMKTLLAKDIFDLPCTVSSLKGKCTFALTEAAKM